jgi:hypothetical protein
MTGPPARWPGSQAAPPIKRANPDGIPVRLCDGALIAHVDREIADRLVESGAASHSAMDRANICACGRESEFRARNGAGTLSSSSACGMVTSGQPGTSRTRIDNPASAASTTESGSGKTACSAAYETLCFARLRAGFRVGSTAWIGAK